MDFNASGVEETDKLSTINTTLASLGQFQSGTIDVRQYASYYLALQAQVSGGPAAQYDGYDVHMQWIAAPFSSLITFDDNYDLFADETIGTFQVQNGVVELQDAMHGPYMQMIITNPTPDQITFSGTLLGSTRQVNGPLLRASNDLTAVASGIVPNRGIILTKQINLAAGVGQQLATSVGYGLQQIRVLNPSANPVVVTVNPIGLSMYTYTVAAGADDLRTIWIPKAQTIMILSSALGSNNVRIVVMNTYDKAG